jgi:hypothetical protein
MTDKPVRTQWRTFRLFVASLFPVDGVLMFYWFAGALHVFPGVLLFCVGRGR